MSDSETAYMFIGAFMALMTVFVFCMILFAPLLKQKIAESGEKHDPAEGLLMGTDEKDEYDISEEIHGPWSNNTTIQMGNVSSVMWVRGGEEDDVLTIDPREIVFMLKEPPGSYMSTKRRDVQENPNFGHVRTVDGRVAVCTMDINTPGGFVLHSDADHSLLPPCRRCRDTLEHWGWLMDHEDRVRRGVRGQESPSRYCPGHDSLKHRIHPQCNRVAIPHEAHTF